MPKTIVILFDGTSNSISEQRSNVLRLYGCLCKSPAQLVYYDPGVGTLGAPGLWSRLAQRFSELWGLATGFGIDENVKAAYRFLVETYDNGRDRAQEPDRIVLMGFSRGAYSARLLAGFLHNVGLVAPRNLNLVDHAWRAYKRIGEEAGEDAFAEVRLYERILATERPRIHLLGLFDTVSSLIEPGRGLLPTIRRHHPSTSRNPAVAHVRHAAALDERRRMFDLVRWPERQPHCPDPARPEVTVDQDAREVWFAGCHADVGGGLAEAESALAKIPLAWLIDESAALGLDYDPAVVAMLVDGQPPGGKYVAPDARAPIHPSMTAAWWVLEYLPLPLRIRGMLRWVWTRGRGRSLPAGARIHASALARGLLPAPVPAGHRVEGDPADWRAGPRNARRPQTPESPTA